MWNIKAAIKKFLKYKGFFKYKKMVGQNKVIMIAYYGVNINHNTSMWITMKKYLSLNFL